MPVPIQTVAVLDEKLWNAWLLRHKLRELRNARRMKLFLGVLVTLAASGAGIFFLIK